MMERYAHRPGGSNRSAPPSVHARRAALHFRRHLVLEALARLGCRFAGRVRAPHRVLALELERLDHELVGTR